MRVASRGMRSPYSRTKSIIFSLIPAVLLILSIEAATRLYFACKYRSGHYLTFGFRKEEFYGFLNKNRTGQSGKCVQVYDSVKHKLIVAGKNDRYIMSVPGIYEQRYGFHSFKVAVNSQGFRGKEISVVKSPNVCRIFCLGGSSTEGLEVEDGKDYPSLLEAKLNSSGRPPKAEVINAGYMGSISDMMRSLFFCDILKYEPNIVIIYAGFNDYHFFIDNAHIIESKFKAAISEYLMNSLLSRSLLFRVLYEKRYIYAKKVYARPDVERVIANFGKNLNEIVKSARKNNVKLILAKQGLNIDGSDMSAGEAGMTAISRMIDLGKPITRDEIYLYMYLRIRGVIEKIGADNGIAVADVAGVLSKYPPEEVYYDMVHLTEKGNEVIAGTFEKKINER